MSKNKSKGSIAPPGAGARTTKIDRLLELMRRPEGSDIATLTAATGWQAHSIRGAISGQIKKKFGLSVTTTKLDGKTIYRLAT